MSKGGLICDVHWGTDLNLVWADVMGVGCCVFEFDGESKDLGLCIVVLRNTCIKIR